MFKTCIVPSGKTSEVLIIEAGKCCGVFEVWSGEIQRTFDITIESGASCVIVTWNQADHAVIRQRGRIKGGGQLHWINVTCGLNVDHILESKVCGEKGRSTIDWVCLGSLAAEQRIVAQNIFDAPCGRGDVTMYGAALDCAHIQCDGKIKISCNGNGTETSLREGVLILDPKASVRIIPCLDVRTNNVKASHSATVSRLTDDDLFYFGSRGIERRAARQMLIEGFLGEIIKQIPDVNLRKRIEKGLFPKTGSGKSC